MIDGESTQKQGRPQGSGARKRYRQRERETADMEAMVKRVLHAIARRAAEGDLDVVSALESIRESVADIQRVVVESLRAEPWSYSWTDIGQALGVSKQAAQQRFGGTILETRN